MRDYTIMDGNTGTFYSLTVDRDGTVFETTCGYSGPYRRDLTRAEMAAKLRAYRNDPKRYSIVRW